MKLFIILVMMLGVVSVVVADDCTVFDYEGYQYKVCGEKIYSRDYSCENACFDEKVKEYRDRYTAMGGVYCSNGWCGLKPYLDDHKCECGVYWMLDNSEYTKNMIKEKLEAQE